MTQKDSQNDDEAKPVPPAEGDRLGQPREMDAQPGSRDAATEPEAVPVEQSVEAPVESHKARVDEPASSESADDTTQASLDVTRWSPLEAGARPVDDAGAVVANEHPVAQPAQNDDPPVWHAAETIRDDDRDSEPPASPVYERLVTWTKPPPLIDYDPAARLPLLPEIIAPVAPTAEDADAIADGADAAHGSLSDAANGPQEVFDTAPKAGSDRRPDENEPVREWAPAFDAQESELLDDDIGQPEAADAASAPTLVKVPQDTLEVTRPPPLPPSDARPERIPDEASLPEASWSAPASPPAPDLRPAPEARWPYSAISIPQGGKSATDLPSERREQPPPLPADIGPPSARNAEEPPTLPWRRGRAREEIAESRLQRAVFEDVRPHDVRLPDPQRVPTDRAPTRGWLRTAARYAAYAVGGYFAVVFVLILAYRFVNPPASALMMVQAATGTDVRQDWVSLEEISPSLIRAVIVSEDWAFCAHYGIDIKAIEQAIERSGTGIPRGASTISMQLTKNLFLWNAKSYVRKAIELPLTLMIETVWPKWRILEVYLNVAEWGPGIFGAEAAAQFHFGKSASQLNDRDAAQLAASLPNPMIRDAGDPGPRTARKASVIQSRMRNAGNAAQCVLGPRRDALER